MLIWLSGGDPDVLVNSSTSEKRKFIKLGLVLLVPAFLAWIGMWFACPYIGIIDTPYKILTAIVWSLIILVIDTYLVSTLDRRQLATNKKGFYTLAAFRLLLAIFIGVISSHPIILKLFESKINEEISRVRSVRILEIYKENRDSCTLWNRINTSTIHTIDTSIACNEKLLKYEWSGDSVVLDCGSTSGRAGRDLGYDRIEKEITSLKRQKDSVLLIIANTEGFFNRKAEQDIDSFHRNFSRDYLARVNALGNLKENDNHTFFAFLVILLFLTLLDSIAVISKVITPATRYEASLTEHEEFLSGRAEREYASNERTHDYATSHSEDVKRQLIHAVYNRAGRHPLADIQQTVYNILHSDDPANLLDVKKTKSDSTIDRLMFLVASIVIGCMLWYVLKITIFKTSKDDLAIGMGLYFTIISIVSNFKK